MPNVGSPGFGPIRNSIGFMRGISMEFFHGCAGSYERGGPRQMIDGHEHAKEISDAFGRLSGGQVVQQAEVIHRSGYLERGLIGRAVLLELSDRRCHIRVG